MAISLITAIILSYATGNGSFHAVSPELIADCGTEINAVTLQTVCSLLYGATWAGASAIWEVEDWSLLKMTALHLIICSAATFPIAYFMRWMNHSVTGVLTYFGAFFVIYAVIWFTQYASIKKKLREINKKIGESCD